MRNSGTRVVRCRQSYFKSQETTKLRLALFKLLQWIVTQSYTAGFLALLGFVLYFGFYWVDTESTVSYWEAGDQRTNGMRIWHLELSVNNEKHLVRQQLHCVKLESLNSGRPPLLISSVEAFWRPTIGYQAWQNTFNLLQLEECSRSSTNIYHIVSYDHLSFS